LLPTESLPTNRSSQPSRSKSKARLWKPNAVSDMRASALASRNTRPPSFTKKQSARSADPAALHHLHALVVRGRVLGPHLGLVEGHVVGDGEIEITVLVEVEEGRARAPAVDAEVRRLGAIDVRAVPVGHVERVAPEVREVEIAPAVAVDVAHAHAVVQRRSSMPAAREPSVKCPCPSFRYSASDGFCSSGLAELRAVRQVHVEVAVVVVVEQRATAADGLGQETASRSSRTPAGSPRGRTLRSRPVKRKGPSVVPRAERRGSLRGRGRRRVRAVPAGAQRGERERDDGPSAQALLSLVGRGRSGRVGRGGHAQRLGLFVEARWASRRDRSLADLARSKRRPHPPRLPPRSGHQLLALASSFVSDAPAATAPDEGQ